MRGRTVWQIISNTIFVFCHLNFNTQTLYKYEVFGQRSIITFISMIHEMKSAVLLSLVYTLQAILTNCQQWDYLGSR